MRELISKIIESICKFCIKLHRFHKENRFASCKNKLRKNKTSEEKRSCIELKLRSMLKNRTQRFYTGNLYHIVLYIFRTFPAI